MKKKIVCLLATVMLFCCMNFTMVFLIAGANSSNIGMAQEEWSGQVMITENGAEINGSASLTTPLNAEKFSLTMNLSAIKQNDSVLFGFSASKQADVLTGLKQDGTYSSNLFGFEIVYDTAIDVSISFLYKLFGETVATTVGNEVVVKAGTPFTVQVSLEGNAPSFVVVQDAVMISLDSKTYPVLTELAAEMFADKEGQTFMNVGNFGETDLSISNIATSAILPRNNSSIGNLQDYWAGKTVTVKDGVATVAEATGVDAAFLGTPIPADRYTVSIDITHTPNGGHNMIAFADAWGIIPFGAMCDPSGFNTSHTLLLYWDVTPASSQSHAIALKVAFREKDSAVPGQDNIQKIMTSIGQGCLWEADKPFTLSVTFADQNPVVTITQGNKSYSEVIGGLKSELFINDSGQTYLSVSNTATVMNIHNISAVKMTAPRVFDNGFDNKYDVSATDSRDDYYLSTPIYAAERTFSFDLQETNASGGWDIFTFANIPGIIAFGYVADSTFNAVDAFTLMYYAGENRFEIYFKEKDSVVEQKDTLVGLFSGEGLIDNSKVFTAEISFAGEFVKLNIQQDDKTHTVSFDGTNDFPAIRSSLFLDANGFTFLNISSEKGNHELTISNINNLPDLSIEADVSDGEYGMTYTLPEIIFDQIDAWGYEKEITVADPEGNLVSLENDFFMPEKIGEYIINVTATDYWGTIFNKQFIFEVKDTSKPVIIVEGVTDTSEVFEEIELPAGQATDNYDQTISVSISVTDPEDNTVKLDNNKFIPEKAGDYTVVYSAVDSHGNHADPKTFTITVAKPSGASVTFSTVSPATAEVGSAQIIEVPEAVANDFAVGVVELKTFITAPRESEAVQIDSETEYTFATTGVYTLYCVAVDVWGNQYTSEDFEVTILDTTAPVIKVEGFTSNGQVGVEISLPAGQATDNYDDDISVNITVTAPDESAVTLTDNKFTPQIAGNYTVIYSATDESGNDVSQPFTITVKAGNSAGDGGNNGGCNSSAAGYTVVAGVLLSLLAVLLFKKKAE